MIEIIEVKEVYKPSFHLIPKNSKGEPDKNYWLKKRMESIGASEIDSVLGLNKWSGPEKILMKKLGIKEIIDKASLDRMAQGNLREEEILDLYRQLTGYRVESLSLKDKIYYNPAYPFLTASLDGLVTRPDGSQYVIDAKLSNTYFWKNGETGYYYGQGQQQMWIMDCPYHEFVVLSPDIPAGKAEPEDLKIVLSDRSDGFIENMIKIASDFWNEVLKQRELKGVNDG